MSVSSSSDNGQSPTPSDRNRSVERLLTDEEIEPYVRRKRPHGESKRRLQGLNEEEQNELRTSINSRERKRMHDLNDAMEELKATMPYEQDANSRRMSKINTLMLASNWIRQLTKTNETLRAENEQLRAELREIRPTHIADKSNQRPDHKVVDVRQDLDRISTASKESDVTQQDVQNQAPDKNLQEKLMVPFIFDQKHLPTIPVLPFRPMVPMPQTICRRPFNQPCFCFGCLSTVVGAMRK